MARAGRGLVAVTLAFLLLFASSGATATTTSTSGASRGMARTKAQTRTAYDLWLARHGKTNNTLGGGEYDHQFRAFWDNLRFVDTHNARVGAHGFHLDLNRFTEEFRAAYLGAAGAGRDRNTTATGERYRHDGVEALPEFVDSRQKGVVAPIKNQGQCGNKNIFRIVDETP
jgi:hypothetical protein